MAGAGARCRYWSRPGRLATALAPALLAAVLAPPVHAATPPKLAGTTVFTASRSAVIVVRIARPTSLTMNAVAKSADVEVSGAGRMVGITMTALRRGERSPMSLMALQVGQCAKRACHAVTPRAASEYVYATRDLPSRDVTGGRRVTLPAGDYAVRSVTDGAPVRVTLRLTGLAGKTTIAVTKPNRLELRTDSSADGLAGVNPMREIGVTHRFDGDYGLMFHVGLSEYEPHVRNHLGLCYYLDRKPPTGHFHPGCPEAEDEFTYMAGQPTTHYYGTRYGSDITLVPGEWTLGFYEAGVGGRSRFDVVTLWLDL